MMDVTITPTPPEISRRFDAAARILEQFAGIDAYQRIADGGAKMMRDRIRAGKDAQGRPLARYSKRYAAKKQGRVDLTLEGTLLDSITGVRDKNEIVFAPRGPHHEVGRATMTNQLLMQIHQTGTVDKTIPARPAFGFTEKEQGLIAGIALMIMESVTVPKLRNALGF